MSSKEQGSERVSGFGSRITLGDEKRLERYFGPLEAAFRRSTFGAMIERLDGDAQDSTPCPRCDGIGFSAEDVIGATRALKRLEDRRRAEIAKRVGAVDAVGIWDEYRRQADEVNPRCLVCDGTGAKPVPRRGQKPCLNVKRWISREGGRSVTVRKKGKPPRKKWMPGPYFPEWLDACPGKDKGDAAVLMPNHEVLVEYAKTSRDLDLVAAIDGKTVKRLGIYYGDEGAVWGRTDHGRIFALYRETKAARQLLNRSGAENPTDLGVSARIAVEADLDRQQPKAWRRQLLNAMDEQARRLFDRMGEVWNRATAPRVREADWREKYDQLLEVIRARHSESERAA